MESLKDNIVDGMIYSFHFQRFPPIATHSMLIQIIGYEACTLEYVEALYRKIDEKKFSLKKPHLLDFPDHVLENVVKELDVEAQAVVRKTCTKLRSLVDNHPCRLERLSVQYYADFVSIHIDDLMVTYFEREEGNMVDLYGPEMSFKREKFIEGEIEQLLIEDLKTILINPKLEIGEFYITDEETYRCYPNFQQFVEMLQSLGHKLHVELFWWEIDYDTDELVKISELMKPDTLKTIKSNPQTFGDSSTLISYLKKKIFNVPQWRRAKTLCCTCQMSSNDYIYLTRFDKVILHIENTWSGHAVTGKMIMAMKNKLLKNKNFDQLLIHNKRDRNPVKKLRAILRPFKSATDYRWAEFSYPDSDKKLLVSVYLHIVWFKGPCYEPDKGEQRLVKLFEDELDDEDDDGGDVVDIDASNEPDVNDPSDVEDDEQATDEEETSDEDEGDEKADKEEKSSSKDDEE